MIAQLVTLAIVLSPFIKPSSASAQGSFNCVSQIPTGSCFLIPKTACPAGYEYPYEVCNTITDKDECNAITNQPCVPISQAGGPPSDLLCSGGKGINTALGCLQIDTSAFTLQLVKFIIGIAGGIAIIMMLIGTVLFASGGSNPEQVKRGKEIFTGALVGLLFIVFSVVILQIITRDILQLKNFGP